MYVSVAILAQGARTWFERPHASCCAPSFLRAHAMANEQWSFPAASLTDDQPLEPALAQWIKRFRADLLARHHPEGPVGAAGLAAQAHPQH
eukprot:5124336-Lingulodinium_polyedra.AAC.1